MKKAKQKNEAQLMKPIKFSITAQLYDELQELLPATNCRNFSELLRLIIEGKKIFARYYDDLPDELHQQLKEYGSRISKLSKEMVQIVHRLQFRVPTDTEVILADLKAIQCIYDQVDVMLVPLQVLLEKIASRWIIGDAVKDNECINQQPSSLS